MLSIPIWMDLMDMFNTELFIDSLWSLLLLPFFETPFLQSLKTKFSKISIRGFSLNCVTTKIPEAYIKDAKLKSPKL